MFDARPKFFEDFACACAQRTLGMLALCVLVLGLSAVVGSRMLDHDLAARPRIAHVRDLALGIDTLSDDLLVCESSQRGYLLTGNVRYLLPFDDRADQVERDVRSLQALTATDLEARTEFAPIVPLVTRKMAELQHTVDLATSGHRGQALAVVGTNDGINAMTAIRSRLATMSGDQRRRLNEMYSANLENAQGTRQWIVDDIAFAWVLVVAALVSLYADRKRKSA